jgi:hypothetical protein
VAPDVAGVKLGASSNACGRWTGWKRLQCRWHRLGALLEDIIAREHIGRIGCMTMFRAEEIRELNAQQANSDTK